MFIVTASDRSLIGEIKLFLKCGPRWLNLNFAKFFLQNDGWEVTSDPKNLCSLFILENVVSQSCGDFYNEAKKL